MNGFFRSVTYLHQREPALFFSFSLLSKQSAVSYVNADRPELTPQASFRVGATVLPSDESWYNLAASPKNQAAVCAAVDFGVFLVDCAPIPGIRHQSAGTGFCEELGIYHTCIPVSDRPALESTLPLVINPIKH